MLCFDTGSDQRCTLAAVRLFAVAKVTGGRATMMSVEERLARARTRLGDDGIAAADLIDDEIAASWTRCLQAGLDPERPPPMQVLESGALRAAREQHELVSRLALAEMRSLYHQIAGTNYLIAFAAPDGMLLETLSDPTFLPMAQRSGICPGGMWGEAARGTNALGTVAKIGRPITVHGGEHFFAQFGGLTCTATPVFGPDAQLIGVLDASSDCRSRQQHTRAIVSMAATHIENGLFREYHRSNVVLTFHSRAEYLHTTSAGLIAFDADGCVLGTNAQARFLLQGLPVVPGRRFGELFRISFEALIGRARRQDRLLLNDVVGSAFVASAENLPAVPVVAVSPAPRPPLRFVAGDATVAATVRRTEQAAARRLPILIRGETGTGKEQLARHAHEASNRRGAFVPVNCAALPRSLTESELFGYADGAFTGARRRGAKGLVEEADGGTLFLDEIGDMPLDTQAVLLRLLDDWVVRPLGAGRGRRVDILMVAATNADLESRIADGRFRSDLFFRLGTIEVRLPPLAERHDFADVATWLLQDLAPGTHLTPDALERLRVRRWSGNIRELRNALTRLTLEAGSGVVDGDMVRRLLGADPAATPAPGAPASPLRQEVVARIAAVCKEEGGNVSRAARRLGVSRNTVYRALRGED